MCRYDTRLPLTLLKEHLDLTHAPVFATVKGTITFLKTESPLMYPACPKMSGDRQCNKKLREEHNAWYCEKCNAAVEADQQDWRYLFSVMISDNTGLQWMTAFAEAVRVRTPVDMTNNARRGAYPCPCA